MAAASDIIKHYSLWVDGRGYAGNVTELTLPELALITEDFRAGGMDTPIAVGMGIEGLELSYVLSSYDRDVLNLFGLVQNASKQVTIRGAAESYDGSTTPVVVNARGRITRIARATWNGSGIPNLTITMRLDYYKETLDGVLVYEIDPINMVRNIGGTDELAAARAAIGL